jgi:hypothetical protein
MLGLSYTWNIVPVITGGLLIFFFRSKCVVSKKFAIKKREMNIGITVR